MSRTKAPITRFVAAAIVLVGPVLTYGFCGPSLLSGDGLGTLLAVFVCGGCLMIAGTLSVAEAKAEDARWSTLLVSNVILFDALQAALIGIVARNSFVRGSCAFAIHAMFVAVLVSPPGLVHRWPRPPRRSIAAAAVGGLLFVLTLVIAYQAWRTARRRASLLEASRMVSGIRAAQEVYRSESGHYADISRALAANQKTNHFAIYPQTPSEPAREAFPWGVQCPESACKLSWQVIPVYGHRTVYGYTTVAGSASAGRPANVLVDGKELAWSPPAGEWFIVSGIGDPTGEASYTTILASSLWPELRIDNP